MALARPDIEDIQTGNELKRWYWLKEELVNFCKLVKINYSGSKFAILERIADFLDNGTDAINKSIKTKQPISKFNWAKSILTLETLITDSYTNGPNSRKFFKEYCGDKFHFSIPFMNFMKSNIGKTLQDAVNEWKRLDKLSKEKSFKSEIPEGNQYNKYIRDFFADNPEKTISEARHFWKLKRDLPLGRHIYEKTDLDLK